MDTPVTPGTVLADKYAVERVLGQGGMGIVVAAKHLQLDEPVAIKFLLPEGLANAQAVARFAREARAAVKIKSEHVARVTDVGTLESGAPYMVMEYLEGEDLGAWLATRGALPIEQAVEFVLQGCEAMAEAHSLGIVHRDLKPANLFCIRRSDGLLSIKVLDFGISKVTTFGPSGPEMSMTKTATVMGSPLYMSPEQMRSARSADARSDIWAIGAILYELLAGRAPFLAETFPELVLKIASEEPPAIRGFRPDVVPELEWVILRCLRKEPAERYANVAELALALFEFGPKRARSSVERVSRVIQSAGLSASALALPPSSTDVESPTRASATLASWGRTATQAPHGKRRRLALYAGLGIAVIGTTVAIAAWFQSSDRAHEAASLSSAEGLIAGHAAASSPNAAEGSEPTTAPSDQNARPATSAMPSPSASETKTDSPKPVATGRARQKILQSSPAPAAPDPTTTKGALAKATTQQAPAPATAKQRPAQVTAKQAPATVPSATQKTPPIGLGGRL